MIKIVYRRATYYSDELLIGSVSFQLNQLENSIATGEIKINGNDAHMTRAVQFVRNDSHDAEELPQSGFLNSFRKFFFQQIVSVYHFFQLLCTIFNHE